MKDVDEWTNKWKNRNLEIETNRIGAISMPKVARVSVKRINRIEIEEKIDEIKTSFFSLFYFASLSLRSIQTNSNMSIKYAVFGLDIRRSCGGTFTL